MDQDLNTQRHQQLFGTAEGVIKNLHHDGIAAAFLDLTYDTLDPFAITLRITALANSPEGHIDAESADWIIGRGLLMEGIASGEPCGEGDVVVHYERHTDQLSLLFTDVNLERNPLQRATHRLVVDAEPVRNLLHHAYRIAPSPEADVDKFLAEVLGEQ